MAGVSAGAVLLGSGLRSLWDAGSCRKAAVVAAGSGVCASDPVSEEAGVVGEASPFFTDTRLGPSLAGDCDMPHPLPYQRPRQKGPKLGNFAGRLPLGVNFHRGSTVDHRVDEANAMVKQHR